MPSRSLFTVLTSLVLVWLVVQPGSSQAQSDVRLWHAMGNELQGAFGDISDRYRKDHGNSISVTGFDSANALIKALRGAKEQPDIVFGSAALGNDLRSIWNSAGYCWPGECPDACQRRDPPPFCWLIKDNKVSKRPISANLDIPIKLGTCTQLTCGPICLTMDPPPPGCWNNTAKVTMPKLKVPFTHFYRDWPKDIIINGIPAVWDLVVPYYGFKQAADFPDLVSKLNELATNKTIVPVMRVYGAFVNGGSKNRLAAAEVGYELQEEFAQERLFRATGKFPVSRQAWSQIANSNTEINLKGIDTVSGIIITNGSKKDRVSGGIITNGYTPDSRFKGVIVVYGRDIKPLGDIVASGTLLMNRRVQQAMDQLGALSRL